MQKRGPTVGIMNQLEEGGEFIIRHMNFWADIGIGFVVVSVGARIIGDIGTGVETGVGAGVGGGRWARVGGGIRAGIGTGIAAWSWSWQICVFSSLYRTNVTHMSATFVPVAFVLTNGRMISFSFSPISSFRPPFLDMLSKNVYES